MLKIILEEYGAAIIDVALGTGIVAILVKILIIVSV